MSLKTCLTAAGRFHEVEPQSSVLELLRPSQLSRKMLATPRGRLPASELATNTLVLSGAPTPPFFPLRISGCITDLMPPEVSASRRPRIVRSCPERMPQFAVLAVPATTAGRCCNAIQNLLRFPC